METIYTPNVKLSAASVKIRRDRANKLVSLERLQEITGIPKEVIFEYENGQRKIPEAHFRKIVSALQNF